MATTADRFQNLWDYFVLVLLGAIVIYGLAHIFIIK